VCLSFCHHCHGRKVIFLICPLARGPCLGNDHENGSENSAGRMSFVVGGEV